MAFKDKEFAKKYYREYAKAQRAAMTDAEKEEFYRQRYERDAEKYRLQRLSLREKAIKKLGSKCSNPNCSWLNEDGSRGCKDTRCLQIDHKFGGGSRERKQLGGDAQRKIYKAVLQDEVGKFQLLCANCNWIKRAENKEYMP